MRFSRFFLAIGLAVSSTTAIVLENNWVGDAWLTAQQNRFVEDWNWDAKKCLERAKRGGPLLFAEKSLSRDERNLLRNHLEHIMQILDEFQRDGPRYLAAVRDIRKQFKKIMLCLPNYKLLRVEEFIDAFIAVRDLGLRLRRLRWRNGCSATALGDDLLVYLLRLIGFINNQYGTEETPEWLIEIPGQAIGSMLSYLHYDITSTHGCTFIANS